MHGDILKITSNETINTPDEGYQESGRYDSPNTLRHGGAGDPDGIRYFYRTYSRYRGNYDVGVNVETSYTYYTNSGNSSGSIGSNVMTFDGQSPGSSTNVVYFRVVNRNF